MVQVCEGIAYIHAKGVMHRSLSIDSVVLCTTSPPEPLVVDSGIAALSTSNKAKGIPLIPFNACIATQAPEVLRGLCTYSSDVWSLGCCLFAVICRTMPSAKPSGARSAVEVLPYPFG